MNKMSIFPLYTPLKTLLLTALLFLSGCEDFGSESRDSDVGAPSSIIDYKAVFRVSSSGGAPGVIKPGESMVFTFVDSRTVHGSGVLKLNTTYWSYSKSGNEAKVTLQYKTSTQTFSLKFSSPTSGTFEGNSLLTSGTKAWYNGSFTIQNTAPQTTTEQPQNTIDSTSQPTTVPACNEKTATLTIYTNEGNKGNLSVQLNGRSIGSLSGHYATGNPPCGNPSEGSFITQIVSPNIAQSITASTQDGTQWNGSITLAPCACSTFILKK